MDTQQVLIYTYIYLSYTNIDLVDPVYIVIDFLNHIGIGLIAIQVYLACFCLWFSSPLLRYLVPIIFIPATLINILPLWYYIHTLFHLYLPVT